MSDGTPPELLVDAKEAARLLGLGERTVRRRIATGELASLKQGRQRLIPMSAIRAAQMAQRHAAAAVPDTVSPDVPSGMPAGTSPAIPAETAAMLPFVDRIASLERENGRLMAELAQARAELGRALPGGERGAENGGTRDRQRRVRDLLDVLALVVALFALCVYAWIVLAHPDRAVTVAAVFAPLVALLAVSVAVDLPPRKRR
jgi:excisionase family DNA binding protein